MKYETLTTVVHPDAGGRRPEALWVKVAGALSVAVFWGLFLYALFA